jgi:hypothetical protein
MRGVIDDIKGRHLEKDTNGYEKREMAQKPDDNLVSRIKKVYFFRSGEKSECLFFLLSMSQLD